MLGTDEPGRGATAPQPAPARGARATLRRLLVGASRVLPAVLALILTFLALRPMLFSPAAKLVGTLASMVGVGLSFAAVTFSAANAADEQPVWSRRMIEAGLKLMRFSLAFVVALALATARERAVDDFGAESWLDYLLRALMAVVTGAGIGAAFFGFRDLVILLVPRHSGSAKAEGLR